MFESRRHGRALEPDRYPIGPALRCAKCGNILSGSTAKRKNRAGEVTGDPYHWYGCRSPRVVVQDDGTRVRVKPCGGVSVDVEELHELVGAAVDEWSQTDAARRAAGRRPEIGNRRAELTAQRAGLVDRMDTMTARFNANRMSKHAFADQSAYLDERFDAIDAELEALAAETGTLLPAVDPWATLSGPDRLKAVYLALETPIIVGAPAKGRKGPARERVTLEYRNPAA